MKEVSKVRENLKNKREKKGWSVSEISKLLGISTSHYYKIESGIRNPNFILAGKIAKLLDSNVDEIFFEKQLDETSKKQLA